MQERQRRRKTAYTDRYGPPIPTYTILYRPIPTYTYRNWLVLTIPTYKRHIDWWGAREAPSICSWPKQFKNWYSRMNVAAWAQAWNWTKSFDSRYAWWPTRSHARNAAPSGHCLFASSLSLQSFLGELQELKDRTWGNIESYDTFGTAWHGNFRPMCRRRGRPCLPRFQESALPC